MSFRRSMLLCGVSVLTLIVVSDANPQASKSDPATSISIMTKGTVKITKKHGTSYFDIDVAKLSDAKKTYKIRGAYSIATNGAIRQSTDSNGTVLEVVPRAEVTDQVERDDRATALAAPCSLQGNPRTGTWYYGFCNYPQSCVHHKDAHNDYC